MKKKVLYCNPIFLDYRLPYYKKLNELFNGNFYILFSRWRYEGRADALLKRIISEMGDNAIPFDGDKVWNTKTKTYIKKPNEQGKLIPIVHGLFRRLYKEKPDILITEGFFQWTPIIILYGMIFRKPVFMGYERTCHTERNTKWYHKLHRKITDMFIKGYIVNGKETHKYLLSLKVNPNKIHLGGMNADGKGLRDSISKMPKEEWENYKRRFNNGRGLIYLFTGYLTERKGIKPLLSAWQFHINKYPFDSLVVVGDGNQYSECVSLYSSDHSIYFEGRVEYTEIYKYYAIADVYIMPTIEDNWSLVIPEAMSCGLPVATSIYNGCHVELIKEGVNGFTFDTYKQDTIIDVLDKFHNVDLKEFGKASIVLEEPFNAENSALRTYNALIEIC